MSLDLDQKKAIDKLSQLKAGALFMKMGTGKTKVACDLIRLKIKLIDVVIWIAPASLLNSENYIEEIKKRSRGFFKKINFFSIEGISRSDYKYFKMRSLAEQNKNFCIVDESITIKNMCALRTQRLLSDYSLFDFRIILNGTPITKSLVDLYSQMMFLSPKILKMSEREFADKFLVYFFDGRDPFPWRRWSKPANVAALIEIIRPYVFHTDLKSDSDVRIYNKEFSLSKQERRKYSKFKDDFLDGKFYVSFFSVAQSFQKAYTTTCAEKFNATLDIVKQIIARKGKVVIFVKYIEEAEKLADALNALMYIGTRKDDLSLFEGEKNVLVCTYGVGSVGLNLQCANNLIYYSQKFDYKEKEQAKYRIYRTGQIRPVNIYNMWVDTMLEDIIRYNLSRKHDLLKTFEKIISVEKARCL